MKTYDRQLVQKMQHGFFNWMGSLPIDVLTRNLPLVQLLECVSRQFRLALA
jgi:hypothetical protein